MKYILYSVIFSIVLMGCSVENAEKIASDLRFSTDTLLFDTLFTQKGSFSKRLTVYNDGLTDVIIPGISISNNSSTFYKLIISGIESNSVENIKLRARDSLLILASVNIDPSQTNLPFIVKDSIEFSLFNNKKYIDLIAWGQNAHFISDSILVCNQFWAADKPYVIYNSILIDSLCSLTIEKGAKIYSHKNSAIFVKGSLIAQGTPAERITFMNDRFDGDYLNYSGQWEGIYFLEGSVNNKIEFTDIKNSIIGIRIGSPDNDTTWDLELNQVLIENSSSYGILSFTSDLKMINTAVVQSGIRAIGLYLGGNYHIENCTLLNHNFSQVRREGLLLMSDNILLADNTVLREDFNLEFYNNVVWGNLIEEITVSNSGFTVFSMDIQKCLLKTQNIEFFNGNIINQEPIFTNYNNYFILPGINSPLIDSGFDYGNTIDLLGNTRIGNPDIGAIESLQ